jgi:hypothetical protein
MSLKLSFTASILFLLIISFTKVYAQNNLSDNNLVKFEPEDGKCLLFIGQDMGAIGGLDKHQRGYADHFEMPAGFTTYTNFSPGGESYGFWMMGNDGLKKKANWGAGDICAQCIIDDPDYEHALVSIGLSLVNNEKKIAKGKHDHLIKDLANWIKDLGSRPVFLRIGYEFDGWDWNHYKKKYYLLAWERIHSIFAEMQVNNVAFVWQSKGTGSGQEILEEWYPGDELVDWCGYSYFGNPDQEMLHFARKHNKPVFIAEATPVLEIDGLYFDTRIDQPKIAKKTWDKWFIPFFETVQQNADVIKAISYINVNWSRQPMWTTNPTFKQVDSRIQVSDYISERWKKEIGKSMYLKSSEELWEQLWNKK